MSGLCDFEVYADRIDVASGSSPHSPGDDSGDRGAHSPFRARRRSDIRGGRGFVVRFTPVAGGIPDSFAFRVGVPPMDADEKA